MVATVLYLASMVCMWRFVVPCINDAAKAQEAQDMAAARDYAVMAWVGFLVYGVVFVFV